MLVAYFKDFKDEYSFLLQLLYIWDSSLLLITKLKTCVYNLSLLVIFQLLDTSLIPSDYPCIKLCHWCLYSVVIFDMKAYKAACIILRIIIKNYVQWV